MRLFWTIILAINILFSFAHSIDSLKNVLSGDLDDVKFIRTSLLLSEQKLEYTEESPLPELEEALKRVMNIDDDSISNILSAEIYGLQGYYYDLYGDYPKAIELYIKALQIGERYNNLTIQATHLSNLGYVYDLKGDYLKSIDYYEKSIKIKEQIGDQNSLAISLNNLGYSYKQIKKYDLSLEYFNRCVEIFQEENDKENLASTLNNIALILENKGDLFAAEHYFLRSLELEKEFNKPVSIALSYINIATNLHKQNKISQAKIYFDIIDSIAETTKIPEVLLPAYNNQSKFYASTKDFRKAYNYYIQFSLLKDSLNSEKSQRIIAEMSEKYESEKKQREIDELNKEKVLSNLKIEKRNQQVMAIGIVLFLVLILLLISIYFFVQKRKSNKVLNQKNIEIEEANEELNQQNEEILTQRDEIESQHKVVLQQNIEIGESIKAAERVQRAFFKDEDDDKKKLPNHFVIFNPKDVVSGDFYWSHVIKNENQHIVYLSVVDCTGHGVPGALMSMLGLSFIKEIIGENDNISPAKLLTLLREKVISEFNQNSDSVTKDGMDVSVVKIDLLANQITYSGANNPIYIVSENELTELKATKSPIGYQQDLKPFEDVSLSYKIGSMIYLFSDGYPDQFGGPRGKKIGYQKFRDLLTLNSVYSIEEQKENLNKFLNDWIVEEEQIDDITLIGIKLD